MIRIPVTSDFGLHIVFSTIVGIIAISLCHNSREFI